MIDTTALAVSVIVYGIQCFVYKNVFTVTNKHIHSLITLHTFIWLELSEDNFHLDMHINFRDLVIDLQR